VFDSFAQSNLGAFVQSDVDPHARGLRQEEDMPITHAIHDAGRGKIFGVRGGCIFEFNDQTGKATGRKLYFAEPIGDAFIALDTTRDLLVVTNWWDPNINDQTDKTLYRKGFFLIDPDTLQLFDFLPMAYMNTTAALQAITPQPIPNNKSLSTTDYGFHYYVDVVSVFPAALFEAGYVGTYFDQEDPGDELEFGPFDQTVRVIVNPGGWSVDWFHFLIQVSGGGPTYHLTGFSNTFTIAAGLTFTVDIAIDLTSHGDETIPRGPEQWTPPSPFHFVSESTAPTHAKNARYQCGPRCVYVMDDGKWLFTEIDSYLDGIDRFGLFDPGTLGLARREGYDAESFNRDGHGWYDIWPEVGTITADAQGVWGTNGRNFIRFADLFSSFPGGTFSHSNKQVYSSPSAKMLCGLAFCDSNDKLYAATASLDVATCLKDSPFTTATFQLPAAAFRKPRRIRYAAFNDRLYLPTVLDNCVIEIDPGDNSVTNTFEGFDVPYDIVVNETDEKVFAVQLGSKPLKLVV
jgi:hypothetical protein